MAFKSKKVQQQLEVALLSKLDVISGNYFTTFALLIA